MRVIRLAAILILATIPQWIFAQQRAQYTQYMNNNYILNPGVGGTEDYVDIKLSARKQWVDFSGSPETYYLTVHSPILKYRGKPHPIRDKQKNFHAVGGLIYDDVTGPTHRSAAQVSYSYNIGITNKIRASLGLLIGVQQFRLDAAKLDFPDKNEIATGQSMIKPDGAVGLWVYNNAFFVGASLQQIFQNNLSFNFIQNQNQENVGGKLSKLTHHYFVTGGFKIPMSHLFTLIPSGAVKYSYNTPLSVDVNAKMRYLDLWWIGISYRNLESFSALAGITINNLIDIGYSYDAVVNGIGPHTMPGGSHEILVGLRLRPGGRVICPSNFW